MSLRSPWFGVYGLILAVMFCGLATGGQGSAEDAAGGMAGRCEFRPGVRRFATSIRGTGYYWLEWVGATANDSLETLLLIRGERPIFADRSEISLEPQDCSQQVIVAQIGVEEGTGSSLE